MRLPIPLTLKLTKGKETAMASASSADSARDMLRWAGWK